MVVVVELVTKVWIVEVASTPVATSVVVVVSVVEVTSSVVETSVVVVVAVVVVTVSVSVVVTDTGSVIARLRVVVV